MKSILKLKFIIAAITIISIYSCKNRYQDEPIPPHQYTLDITFEDFYNGTSNFRAPISLYIRPYTLGQVNTERYMELYLNDSLVKSGTYIDQDTYTFNEGGTYKFYYKVNVDGQLKELTKTITILPPYKSFEITKIVFSDILTLKYRESFDPFILAVDHITNDTSFNGKSFHLSNVTKEALPVTFTFNNSFKLNNVNPIHINLSDISLESNQSYNNFFLHPKDIVGSNTRHRYPDSFYVDNWNHGLDSITKAYIHFKWHE
ncbi:MAG TPA: hypothetical protein VIK89_16525 [Cytophagaceae bacterium]